MILSRPVALEIHRTSGGRIIVPPLTRAQMRRAYALGDCESDDARAEWDYRGALLAIYLEHATCNDAAGGAKTPAETIEDLYPEEEVDVIQAVVAAQHGHNPETVVELQQAMRALLKKKLRPDREPTS